MFRITLDTRELEQSVKMLPETMENVYREVDIGMQEAIDVVIEPRAKQLCPVSKPPEIPKFYHGALRDSIYSRRIAALKYEMVVGMAYGIFQELGFYHWQTGQFIQNPFIKPAIDEGLSLMEQKIKRIVELNTMWMRR